eukprot:NODE_330_length_983_cov_432.802326_g326_i0.p1 GENE.NODE_330_length_983_cov_432.802326_g326_i0~~NODE_330_length_983_cov_432.802326_g326_i0.p1  ORF type:complete len:277 (-),score=46.49 NODE_330_length_983_cov_432.802326_g326_i0:111-941(-)
MPLMSAHVLCGINAEYMGGHERHVLDQYCHEDGEVVCLLCCRDAHSGHRVSHISSIVENMKYDIGQRNSTILQTHRRLAQSVKSIDASMAVLDQASVDALVAVEQWYSHTVEQLSNWMKTLQRDVVERKAQRMSYLRQQRAAVVAHIDVINKMSEAHTSAVTPSADPQLVVATLSSGGLPKGYDAEDVLAAAVATGDNARQACKTDRGCLQFVKPHGQWPDWTEARIAAQEQLPMEESMPSPSSPPSERSQERSVRNSSVSRDRTQPTTGARPAWH